MAFKIIFSEEKNLLLKATRGIGFDEILDAMHQGDVLADVIHPDQKRAHQRLFVIKIGEYAYAVPYVIDTNKESIFLKTAYPSRVLTSEYIKGDSHDK